MGTQISKVYAPYAKAFEDFVTKKQNEIGIVSEYQLEYRAVKEVLEANEKILENYAVELNMDHNAIEADVGFGSENRLADMMPIINGITKELHKGKLRDFHPPASDGNWTYMSMLQFTWRTKPRKINRSSSLFVGTINFKILLPYEGVSDVRIDKSSYVSEGSRYQASFDASMLVGDTNRRA